MNRLWRKIAQTLLLTTLLAVAGIHGYHYARACLAKWAFAHQSYFSDDELIEIRMPQKDLTSKTDFLVDEEEFVWAGEMVDVLHREIRSDTLYIYGFRDKVETELNQETAWLFQYTPQPDKLPATRTRKIYWDTIICAPCESVFSVCRKGKVTASSITFPYSVPRLLLPFLEVLHMPPIQ